MQFKVTKVVLARTSEARGFKKILLILLLIPLLLLFMLASLVLIPIILISSLLIKKPAKEVPATESEGVLLAGNNEVTVRMLQDESSSEFELISKLWKEEVSNGSMHVYRAKTYPRIEGLHDRFITFFCKETPTGVFLQMVEMDEHAANKLRTRLVFLNYADKTVADVVNVGPYMLFNDKTSAWLVKGYNDHDQIELSLSYRDD